MAVDTTLHGNVQVMERAVSRPMLNTMIEGEAGSKEEALEGEVGDGPIWRRVYCKGMVKVRTALFFFTEDMVFELTPLLLKAWQHDVLQWSLRCCNCKVQKGQGNTLVVSSARRTVVFSAENVEETKKWYLSLQIALNQKIDTFLTMGRVVGSGTFGQVHVALGPPESGGKRYAVKVITKDATNKHALQYLRREMDIQTRLSHPSIVRLLDGYETRSHIYMIMDFIPGGMLVDRLMERAQFTEEDARTVMRQLLSAVEYMHKRGVCHRDIKLDNVLCLDHDTLAVKITDFGLSSETGAFPKARTGSYRPMRSLVGTPAYMAPEVTGDNAYDQSVDMWSLGVVLYALLCGDFPFSNNPRGVATDENELGFDRPGWQYISEEARELVRSLLCKAPSERLTAEQALQHQWFLSDPKEFSGRSITIDAEAIRNSERRLRKFVHAVVAMNKLRRATLELEDDSKESISAEDE